MIAIGIITTCSYAITFHLTNNTTQKKFSTQDTSVKVATEPTSVATKSTSKPLFTEPTTQTESPKVNNNSTSTLIETFTPICQYPELPTGCEITSLTMVLNHYGFNIDKGELSDLYLNKGAVGTVDFRTSFVGDPRDSNSYGCYASVIVDCANNYLSNQNSDMRAVDITNTEFEQLFEYTKVNIPVILWCTYELKEGHFSVTWNVEGENLTWYTPEHCMVLLGEENNLVYTADPASGEIIAYDKNLLKMRYEELFKQAVIIQ